MSGLTRSLCSRRDEHGSVAVLVAIVLGAGVVLGLAALVVDVGGMYAERAQLQNGADAGSLSVALGCATGPATCDYGISASSPAGQHANDNANDTFAKVDSVCGNGPAGMPVCSIDPGCSPLPPAGTRYARVKTSTLNPDNSTLLPPAFGEALLGPSYQGSTIHACAQTAWGSPGALDSLAFTFSYCEWKAATSDGTVFAQEPPYPTWPAAYTGTVPAPGSPGAEQVLLLHGSGNACAGSNAAGWDLPGGFGWLADAGSCSVHVDVSGTYHDDTGVSAGNACKVALENARTNRTVLYLPVFDGLGGSGHNGVYHLKGFAAFVVTGYNLPGLKDKSSISNQEYCHGSEKCIYGFFTQGLVDEGGTIGGSDLGARVVQMIG